MSDEHCDKAAKSMLTELIRCLYHFSIQNPAVDNPSSASTPVKNIIQDINNSSLLINTKPLVRTHTCKCTP